MPRIPIPLQSYDLANPADTSRLLNMYAEPLPKDARAQVLLRSVPGLVAFYTLGTGPIRALDASLPGRLYAVSGTQAWRVRSEAEGGAEVIGAVGATGMVTIAVGPTAAVICVPPYAYVCDHFGALHQVTGTADNPMPGVSSVAYQDGYWVFTLTEVGSAKFIVSGLLSPDNYDALDFASADARPNVIERVVTVNGELWFIGQGGLEVWYDAGTADFPFRRQSGGDVAHGCANAASIAVVDGSLFWLGTDAIVHRSEGYKATRISTHAVEKAIHDYGDVNNVTGFAYTQFGHTFYVLTFIKAGDPGVTWVYDLSTELWHERASDGGRWRASCATQLGGTAFLGDCFGGAVCGLADYAKADLDSPPLVRTVTCPPIWAETKRGFMARLELEAEVGSVGDDAAIHLAWSDDGGYSYSSDRIGSLGAGGDRRKRVYWTRLGSFRQRVLRLTSYNRLTILGMDAELEGGAW